MSPRPQLKGQITMPRKRQRQIRSSLQLSKANGSIRFLFPVIALPATYLTREPYECSRLNGFGSR